ncbi:MAG: substrate-binding domain-containing protein [Verrucomicrobiae bacterium]|nr:substrate-binding domain-containing protein [Verrucomicrobiae bacterium]
MKLRLSLVVFSLILSVFIGLALSRQGRSGDGPASKNKKPLIGLSMDTLKEERWNMDKTLFVKRVEELGGEVLVQSANSDDARQIQDIEALLSRGVDALVIIPHNASAMSRAVDAAHRAGVPVLSYDRIITGCDLDLCITFDNLRVGREQAQYLADTLLAGKSRMRIVRIYGSKTDYNAVLFKQGQDDVLLPLIKSGRVEVIHEDWADDWRPENAKKITNAAITKNGKNFDAILASNDGTAGGAIQALLEEGLAGKIRVTGQDADLAACQRILGGTQSMTIYKPIKVLATRAAELAFDMARHKVIYAPDQIDNGFKKVPAVFLDVKLVTGTNMMETVVADGFHKEAALTGKK